MYVTILSVGSRGDIQPYLALAIGLKAVGYRVRFATEANYQDLVLQYGLDFALLPGDSKARHIDPEWLNYVESTQGSVARSLQMCYQKFVVPPLFGLLDAAWQACQGTDAIISTPHIHGCFHIADKLGVPFFMAWTSPGTPTREFPHSWSRFPMQRWWGGALNQYSYRLLERLYVRNLWQVLDRWRQDRLNLPPMGAADVQRLQATPMLYCYSPAVLPKPSDWADQIKVTGYWFLDQPFDSATATALQNFIDAGTPPIYISFGSTVDCQSSSVIQSTLAAILQTGHRAILEAGWATLDDLIDIPSRIFKLSAGEVPHSWLFPKMAVLIHHGGAGTVGEGLRAGKPTIVIYQRFTDYLFWGQQIAKLGVGPQPIPRDRLTHNRLARTIQQVMSDRAMQHRAAELGARIRAENGVQTAIDTFHQSLDRDSPSLVLSV